MFPHFCAGETLESCRAVGARYRRRGVTMLVDHSVEESESDDALAGNLANKIRLLERVAAEVEGAAFVPVKITAVVSPALLEEMTAVIAAHPEHRRSVVNPEGSLSAPAIGALRRAEENLRALCGAAARLGIPVLLDAEQSHRQDAIDHLARGVMREFNRDGKAVVYNTYQMYMTGAGERVSRDLEVAAEHGYCFAAKIVRGAYLVSTLVPFRSRGDTPRCLHCEHSNTLLSSITHPRCLARRCRKQSKLSGPETPTLSNLARPTRTRPTTKLSGLSSNELGRTRLRLR